jgi:diguanylate cyclase (GGDEF)-like protein/PAS domain S-box-containing protein
MHQSRPPRTSSAASRRLLGILALAMAALFLVDLLLPPSVPLLPYYFVLVVLAANVATPRQMWPLLGEAWVLTVVAASRHGVFPSLDFGTRLLALTGVALLALRLSAQRCRELEARRQAEETLRLTIDNAAAGIGMADARGRLLRCNPALCTMLGRDADTLRTLSWTEITHPDDAAQERVLVEEMLANRRASFRIRKRYLHADGSPLWTDLTLSCVRRADGGVEYFIGQVIDISSQVAAEEARARSEALLRRTLEQTHLGLALCAPGTGRFLLTNQELRTELGADAEALQATTLGQALEGLLRQQPGSAGPGPSPAETLDRAALAALLRGERDQYRLRLRLRLAQDKRPAGWGDLRISNLRDEAWALTHVLVELADVTEIVAKSDSIEAAAAAGVVGVWDWDPVEDVLTWDPVMYRLYGVQPDQFSGAVEAWAQTVHPDDRSFAEGELQAAVRGERDYAIRFRVLWPDGSVRYIQAASRGFLDGEGRVVRILGVNYDVTELVNTQERLAAEQHLLSTTLDSLLDPHVLLGPVRDEAGRITDLRILRANPAASAYNGMSPEEFVGATLRQFWPGHVENGLFDRYLQVLATGEPLVLDDFEYNQHERQGGPRQFDIRVVKVGDELSVIFRDVTERAESMRLLAASEEQFRLLAENASDVVVHFGGDGTVRWISPSLRTMLGWDPGDWIGRPKGEMLAAIGADPIPRDAWRQASPQTSRHQVRDRQGRLHWLESRWSPFLDTAGEPAGEVCTCRLIDNEMAAERELERRASTDSLTTLLNREEVFRQIQQLSGPEQRRGRQMAVLFCDLDRFKSVNDTYGHQGGDAVLQAMAYRVRSCLRGSDLAARIGGDELLVVLPGLQGLEDAIAIAEKVRRLASEPVPLPEGEVQITLSVGVALAEEHESIDALIARADAAMYAAKQQGRDQVVAISPVG